MSGVSEIKKPANPGKDSIDLKGMARWCLNYLRGNPDPNRGYECKWALGPLGIPFHVPITPSNKYGFDVVSLGDTDSRMDCVYAYMREVAEEPEPDPVELGVRGRTLGYLRDDNYSWVNPAAAIGETIDGEWILTWTTAKMLYALSETYAKTKELALKKKTRDIMLALKKMAVWKDGAAYYQGIAPYKDGEWLFRNWALQHGHNYPFIVEPLLRYWECIGDDEEGFALAKAFADGFLAEIQPDMGDMRINPETGEFKQHVHLHTHAVWGVAHLGAVTGDSRYTEWARKAHDYVVAMGTDYGWYPEFLPQAEYRSEVCILGDMVSLGAWLARSGMPEYWDTVERTVRNELCKSQFFLNPAFIKLFNEVHKDKPEEARQALKDLRSIEGGFVAQSTFDDLVSYPGPDLGKAGLSVNGIQMMGCCPPEGMRGLWEAWRAVIEKHPEGIFVNLSFSKENELGKVTAFKPECGRLEVTAKAAGAYFIRPPAWVERSGCRLSRNNKNEALKWGGPACAYVECGNVEPGEEIRVEWPAYGFLQSFDAKSISGRVQPVEVKWSGNEVVGVNPPAKYLSKYNPSGK